MRAQPSIKFYVVKFLENSIGIKILQHTHIGLHMCRPIHTHIYVCMCVCSVAQLCATPWTLAHQAPLSMEFSRQEYWSGLPFHTSEDLLDPGIKSTLLASPAWTGGLFTTVPPGKPICVHINTHNIYNIYMYIHTCVFILYTHVYIYVCLCIYIYRERESLNPGSYNDKYFFFSLDHLYHHR